MSKESKGKEFFESLSPVEKQVILEIMKLENTPERLLVGRSTVVENKIKDLIGKNSKGWNENDI